MMFGSRGPVYTLGSTHTTGDTSIVLAETPDHIGIGSIVSMGYEVFYVQSINVPSKTLTVIPGYLGTTPATHTTPAVIEVDPRFPKSMLFQHVEEELRSWGQSLPRVTSVNLGGATNERSIDLAGVTGEIYHLLDVRAEPETASQLLGGWSWVGDSWAHVRSRLIRGLDTAQFPSGYALQLLHYPHRSGQIRVTVSQPLNLAGLASGTDLETTCGVEANWLDIINYGVRARCLAGDVASRSDWRAAGHARDAEESNVLDLIRGGSQAAEMRNDRFTYEAMEFRAAWPYRSR